MICIQDLLKTLDELRNKYHFDDSETLVGFSDYDVVICMRDPDVQTQIVITKPISKGVNKE